MKTLTEIAPYVFWFFAVCGAIAYSNCRAYNRGWRDGQEFRARLGQSVLTKV